MVRTRRSNLPCVASPAAASCQAASCQVVSHASSRATARHCDRANIIANHLPMRWRPFEVPAVSLPAGAKPRTRPRLERRRLRTACCAEFAVSARAANYNRSSIFENDDVVWRDAESSLRFYWPSSCFSSDRAAHAQSLCQREADSGSQMGGTRELSQTSAAADSAGTVGGGRAAVRRPAGTPAFPYGRQHRGTLLVYWQLRAMFARATRRHCNWPCTGSRTGCGN